MQARGIFIAALLATVAVYWTGLSGPFLFDDIPNFEVLERWLHGQAPWQQVVFGHHSLLLARPIAMASFLLNASLWGDDAFGFKLGNLIAHLACGVLVWQVLRRSLAKDTSLSAHAELIAAIIAALWLLHPLHVSTVLYAVQRMAQLSTLFTLTAILLYLIARQQLIAGRLPSALLNLFGWFPLLVVAGLLCKQNAVVAPALCLVLELAYFGNQPRMRRVLSGFFSLFLLLPVLAGMALLMLMPERLLGDYALYDFSLVERLLSQPRALMDYIGQILLPRGPLMGLYTDDFAPSTSLLSPITTLWSITSLTALSIFALTMRKRAPSLFAGWFFFLAAHGVESSFLPLDLYFEHRNYLPAMGLLLAVAGLLALAPKKITASLLTPFQLKLLAISGLSLVFVFSTFGRVLVWKDKLSIVDQGLRYHPHSLRAMLDKAALERNRGHDAAHDAILRQLAASNESRHRMLAKLYLVSVACIRRTGSDPALLASAVTDASPHVTLAEVHAFSVLSIASKAHGCGNITDSMIAESMVKTVDAAVKQPDWIQPKWLLRFTAAGVYARAGMLHEAQQQAELSWQPGADPAMGALLAELYAHNGRLTDAKRTLAEATLRTKANATADQAALKKLKHWLDSLPLP